MHTIRMNLPQFDWPENPMLAERFSGWLAEFAALREREPTLAEMIEWAYREGIKASADSQPQR